MVLPYQQVKAWFEHWHEALLQLVDLGLINIHAQHLMAYFCQTSTADKTHITTAVNCYFHNRASPVHRNYR